MITSRLKSVNIKKDQSFVQQMAVIKNVLHHAISARPLLERLEIQNKLKGSLYAFY